jgi:hypothetical protein
MKWSRDVNLMSHCLYLQMLLIKRPVLFSVENWERAVSFMYMYKCTSIRITLDLPISGGVFVNRYL